MIINHNTIANNISKQLKININSISKSSEKLSSGFGINKSADNASGLAISEKMRSQIRGLNISQRNIQDAYNLVQVADGALKEVNSIIKRTYELVVQSLNDTNTDSDREKIQDEIDGLIKQIDDISLYTEFNTIKIFGQYEKFYVSNDNILGSISTNARTKLVNPTFNPQGKLGLNAIYNDNSSPIQLLYGGNNPTTSYPKIKIMLNNGDIINRNIWGSPTSTTSNSAIFNFSEAGKYNIDITMKCNIINNPSHLRGQSYEITYHIKNNSTDNVKISLMHHFDIQIGSNDSAPFRVNSNELKNATSYIGNSIPSQVHGLESLNKEQNTVILAINAVKTNGFNVIEPPDKLNIGHFSSVKEWNFDTSNSSLGDSGYAVIWENRNISAGSSFKANTFLGVINRFDTSSGNNSNPSYIEKIYTDNYFYIQDGPNSNNGDVLRLKNISTSKLKIDTIDVRNQSSNSNKKNLVKHNLTALQEADAKISSFRTYLGAKMNLYEHKLSVNQIAFLNLSQSESIIRDSKISDEIIQYNKENILSKVKQSLFAQANQIPERVLMLLH